MACGKSVIGTRVWGNPEVIKNNFNGLLVPPKDSMAIKGAVLKLIDNPKLQKKLCKNARRTIENSFEMNKQLHKLFISLFRT